MLILIQHLIVKMTNPLSFIVIMIIKYKNVKINTLMAFLVFIVISGCTVKTVPQIMDRPSQNKWAEACTTWDDWDKPGPPFRIYGNSYYVGTCGISAILITSNDGHVLIDGGTEAGADIIAENIKSLGFSMNDVRFLLHSHEHFDHVAGLAKLQELSSAKLFASPEAAPVLQSGIASKHDPQAGMHEKFPPSNVGEIIKVGQSLTLGNLTFLPIATPGHTQGALSWQWQSCENTECVIIVYADSLSPISHDSYLFSEHPQYVDDYKIGIRNLSLLECEILLTPHPSASKMRKNLLSPEGLFDKNSCKNYAESISNRLNKRLENEELTE
jgi:metallo-beta-lactamase class B